MTVYRVHFSNHGYFAEARHASLEEAVEAGKRACFEFTVHPQEPGERPGFPLVAWSPIGGRRTLSFH